MRDAHRKAQNAMQKAFKKSQDTCWNTVQEAEKTTYERKTQRP